MKSSALRSEKPSILYVDDERENLLSFKALFRRDYQVHLAETAREALDILRTRKIHVLVTDQRMPEMTGTDLLECVAADHPDVLRYMLTGYSDYDPLVDAINKGRVHGYFTKPLNPPEFSERVHKGLEMCLLREHNRQLLADLQESQERLRQAHQLAHIGIWSWNREEDRTEWSDELFRIAGRGPEAGAPSYAELSSVFGPESLASLQAAVARALESGESYGLELELLRPDGSVRWVLAFGGPIVGPDGAVVGLHGMVQDITAEKESTEELRRARDAANAASDAKSEFLANMSHEIRTPLNGMLGMLQLLGNTQREADRVRYQEMALNCGKRLLQLLTDILDFSALEAGRMPFRADELDLHAALLATQNTFELAYQGKGLRFTSILDDSANVALLGDNARIQQVLFNLAGNAVKFTDIGSVTVSAWCSPGAVPDRVNLYLAVSDTGTGIPDHLQHNVFESFFQAQSGYTREYQGSGLGLAIVRKIVRRMGGSVCIDSTEGEGTTVYVHLPLRRQREARPVPAQTAQRQDALPPRLRILVVDDESVGRMALQVTLERMGHEVDFAGDGAEALECLRAKRFDCVFMDIQMPRMNGIAATRTLRSDPAFKDSAHVYVIAMTAYAMSGDRELFLADGMDDYVSKPASITDIEESLARYFARR